MVATKGGIRLSSGSRKRESFSPSDKEWLKSHKDIQLGDRLGEGLMGEVFTVKDNPRLVIKVPRGYKKNDKITPSDREYMVSHMQWDLLAESKFYAKNALRNEDLFIPSKLVKLPKKPSIDEDFKFYGIVRPRIKQLTNRGGGRVSDSIKQRLTKAVMEDIRKKVILLSHKGYAFNDGLQLGLNSQGKPYLYDLGFMSKRKNEMTAFATNEAMWEDFLVETGKAKSYDHRDIDEAIAKYGDINEFDY